MAESFNSKNSSYCPGGERKLEELWILANEKMRKEADAHKAMRDKERLDKVNQNPSTENIRRLLTRDLHPIPKGIGDAALRETLYNQLRACHARMPRCCGDVPSIDWDGMSLRDKAYHIAVSGGKL